MYDICKNELLIFQKYLIKNLIKEFIKASLFKYFLSILFVKKFDKNLRFCVDYQELNAIIKKHYYFISFVQKTLNRFYKTKYYFKIDIIAIFNRLRIVFDHEKHIAFRIQFDLFEYLIIFFEFYNISSF